MSKPRIYDLHDKAFAQVSAFCIVRGHDRVATLALKFPKDGAGRLFCYLHVIGLEMVRDYAGGYGYDKRSAAVTHAAAKIKVLDGSDPERAQHAMAIKEALKNIGGKDWQDCLREAGYTVFQAV